MPCPPALARHVGFELGFNRRQAKLGTPRPADQTKARLKKVGVNEPNAVKFSILLNLQPVTNTLNCES